MEEISLIHVHIYWKEFGIETSNAIFRVPRIGEINVNDFLSEETRELIKKEAIKNMNERFIDFFSNVPLLEMEAIGNKEIEMVSVSDKEQEIVFAPDPTIEDMSEFTQTE